MSQVVSSIAGTTRAMRTCTAHSHACTSCVRCVCGGVTYLATWQTGNAVQHSHASDIRAKNTRARRAHVGLCTSFSPAIYTHTPARYRASGGGARERGERHTRPTERAVAASSHTWRQVTRPDATDPWTSAPRGELSFPPDESMRAIDRRGTRWDTPSPLSKAEQPML